MFPLFSTLYDIERNDPVNQLVANSQNYANLIQQQSQALWDREDSAYQRMVADMEKAGLNPWTGVSSGGLSAGSNVPALDSLTGLVQVLGTMIDNKRLKIEGINSTVNGASKLAGVWNDTLNAIGSLIGRLS